MHHRPADHGSRLLWQCPRPQFSTLATFLITDKSEQLHTTVKVCWRQPWWLVTLCARSENRQVRVLAGCLLCPSVFSVSSQTTGRMVLSHSGQALPEKAPTESRGGLMWRSESSQPHGEVNRHSLNSSCTISAYLFTQLL